MGYKVRVTQTTKQTKESKPRPRNTTAVDASWNASGDTEQGSEVRSVRGRLTGEMSLAIQLRSSLQ